MHWSTLAGFVLLALLLVWIYRSKQEGFLAILGWDVGFPRFPDDVETSGTDELTPLPYWVAYGAPGYWPASLSPYWYYDVPWYGPINSPWGAYGRAQYRPWHGPGYSGVAVGGGGGGGHGGHGGHGGGGGGGGGHH